MKKNFKEHQKQIKDHVIRRKLEYVASLFMIVAVSAVGVSLTHFGFASAEVSTDTVTDIVTNPDTANNTGGAVFDATGEFPVHGLFYVKLTADAGETLNSLSLTINSVTGTDSGDFGGALPAGTVSFFVGFDTNDNDSFDFGEDDIVGFAAPSPDLDVPITLSLSSPHDVPSSESGDWNYAIYVSPSSTAVTGGDQFSVTLNSYTLSTGPESATTTSGVVTVSKPVAGVPLPTVAGTTAPADGVTDFIPANSVSFGFDRPLATTTVTTSNVVLKTHVGNAEGGALTGSNLCGSVYTGSVNGISDMAVTCQTSSGMSIDTWYTITLTTGIQDNIGGNGITEITRTFKTAEINTTGNVTPPHIIGSAPKVGQQNFPPNGSLIVNFEDNPSGNLKTSGTGSVTNTANIILQEVVNGVPDGTNICASSGCSISFSYNADQHSRITITPSSTLGLNTEYELKISSSIRNDKNLSLGNDYIVGFTTASAADTAGPFVQSVNPVNGSTGVARNLDNVRIQYNESIQDSTVNENSMNFFLDANANGAMDGAEFTATTSLISPNYNDVQNAVYIGFKQLLAANSQYCFESGTDLDDLVGNDGVASVHCFTTSASYTPVAPTLVNVDVDQFIIQAEFDQPITGAATNTFSLESPVGTSVSLANATVEYFPAEKAVRIFNFDPLTADNSWKLSVSSGVKELGGTTSINSSEDEALGTVLNADNTGGSFVAGDFGNTNFEEFWENPEYCSPHSLAASSSGKMFCEFPTPVGLATDAKIVLTAPSGFDVSNVTALSASQSFTNADMNGYGPGVTTIKSLAKNAAARTITITLTHTGTGANAMQANDQIMFELDGIVNPPNAVDGVSFSYFVKNAAGQKQGQTKSFAPITIGAAGGSSISGTVCKSTAGGVTCDENIAIENVPVFLDSFGGPEGGFGHQETVTDSNGEYTFTGIGEGSYGIGIAMDPDVIGNVGGGNGFQELYLDRDTDKTNIDFHLKSFSTGGGGNAQTLTVNVTGAPANEEMDVFCFSPGNYEFSAPVMKKVTANGSGAVSSGNTLTLSQNAVYECGIGPSIPFDMLSSGAADIVPDFSFMPPEPVEVHIGTSDETITFVLEESTHEIIGKIVDGNGVAIANVFVDAFPAFGKGFDNTTGESKNIQGGFTKTNASGLFTLKVVEGTYEISACAPGMPCSGTTEVSVKDNTGADDDNAAADVYSGGTLLTGVGLTKKMVKKGNTIAGQVLDENGSAIQYAFVHAEKGSGTCASWTPSGGGFADSPTDSSGNYTLYVDTNSTYRVEAYSPTYGQVKCDIFTIVTTNLSGKNLQASAGAFGTISGTVTKAGANVSGAFVNCFGQNGANQKVTGSDGTYSMKVKSGDYQCDAFLSGAGHVPADGGNTVTITGSATGTVGFAMASNPGWLTIELGSGVNKAYCDARDSNGKGNGTGQNDGGTYTIYVPEGNYTVRCGGPNIGELSAGGLMVVTAGTETVVSMTPPTLYTITGIINDGSNNLSGAAVTFVDDTIGAVVFEQSNGASSGANVSVTLPAGTYDVIASKSGYVDSATPEELTVTANGTFATRSLTQAAATRAVTVQSDGVNYEGGAKVVATRSDGKVTIVDVDATVTSGTNATTTLTEGTWTVEAYGDNGKKATGLTLSVDGDDVVTVAAGSTTMDLATSITGFTKQESTSQSLVPKNGGVFKDTTIDSAIGSGFEVNVPAGVLSTSDSTSGSIVTELDPTLAISTPGKTFIGTAAISITPKTSSGKAIKDLSSSGQGVTLKIPYKESDIPSGTEESDLRVAVWSETVGDWEMLSGAVDTTANTIAVQTTHFSSFGVIGGSGGGASAGGGDGGGGGGDNGGGGGGDNGGGNGGSGGLSIGVNPPTIPADVEALVINEGEAETDVQEVDLTLTAEDATLMAISNTSDFANATFVDYATTSMWTLSEGDGEKTVYVRFRSAEGGSLDVTDTILLTGQGFDQVEPVEIITACGLSPEKAYRALGSNAVYYVGEAHNEDGTVNEEVACAKRPFRSSTKYFTYFASWDDVIITTETALESIPDDVLGFMPWGPQYDPKYGALVKVVTDPKVYLLLGTNKHWITSETVFTGLKYAWNWIEDVADGLLEKYESVGEITSTDVHPNFTIIKYEGDTKVYRLESDPDDPESQVKRHIADEAAFESLTFRWDRIVTVPDTEVYEDGELITAEE